MKNVFGILCGIAVAIGGSAALASAADSAPEPTPVGAGIQIVVEEAPATVVPPFNGELLDVGLTDATVSP